MSLHDCIRWRGPRTRTHPIVHVCPFCRFHPFYLDPAGSIWCTRGRLLRGETRTNAVLTPYGGLFNDLRYASTSLNSSENNEIPSENFVILNNIASPFLCCRLDLSKGIERVRVEGLRSTPIIVPSKYPEPVQGTKDSAWLSRIDSRS